MKPRVGIVIPCYRAQGLVGPVVAGGGWWWLVFWTSARC
jgi:hypothetical protein